MRLLMQATAISLESGVMLALMLYWVKTSSGRAPRLLIAVSLRLQPHRFG